MPDLLIPEHEVSVVRDSNEVLIFILGLPRCDFDTLKPQLIQISILTLTRNTYLSLWLLLFYHQ
jgi:hypothetical protein